MNVRKVAQSEIYVVTNDKSQGTVAKHLSWDGLLHLQINYSICW